MLAKWELMFIGGTAKTIAEILTKPTFRNFGPKEIVKDIGKKLKNLIYTFTKCMKFSVCMPEVGSFSSLLPSSQNWLLVKVNFKKSCLGCKTPLLHSSPN